MEQQKSKHSDFSAVFYMAIPILAELLLRMLLGNVDQWMLSRYSPTAVAAVGNANQILNMGIIVLDMVCAATTIILSQFIGAKRTQEVQKLYTLSLAIVALLSVLMSAILVLTRFQFFRWMKIPTSLVPEAEVYLIIVGATLCFQGFFMAMSAVLRSHAMMKEIMIVSMLMNVVNVLGNFVLINGYGGLPRLGVAGAAISTALSRLIGAGVLLVMMTKRIGIRFDWTLVRHPDCRLLKKIFHVGVPAAGDSISYTCMKMVILTFVNTYGALAVTSKVYLESMLPFVYIYGSAIATATQIRVGYCVGAGEAERATSLVRKSIFSAVLVSLILSTSIYICSDAVFGVFTADPEILHFVRQVLIVDLFLEVGRSVNMIMIRSLLGAGDTSFPLYCAVCSMWGVAVPLAFILGSVCGMGLVGVWIGLAADEWCRALAFILRWKSGRWKTKKIL
ncbi:MAG: MATE family efflux transporter [Ruthenibacterium sp.]